MNSTRFLQPLAFLPGMHPPLRLRKQVQNMKSNGTSSGLKCKSQPWRMVPKQVQNMNEFYMSSTRFIWSQMESNGALWSPMKTVGVIWSQMELYGALWSPMKPVGAIQTAACPCFSIVRCVQPLYVPICRFSNCRKLVQNGDFKFQYGPSHKSLTIASFTNDPPNRILHIWTSQWDPSHMYVWASQ